MKSPKTQEQRVFKEGVVSWAEGCSEAQGGEDRQVSVGGGRVGFTGDLDGSCLRRDGIPIARVEMRHGDSTCKPLSQEAGHGGMQRK